MLDKHCAVLNGPGASHPEAIQATKAMASTRAIRAWYEVLWRLSRLPFIIINLVPLSRGELFQLQTIGGSGDDFFAFFDSLGAVLSAGLALCDIGIFLALLVAGSTNLHCRFRLRGDLG